MYTGNTIANGIGGMLAAGVLGGIDKLRDIAGWRYVTFGPRIGFKLTRLIYPRRCPHHVRGIHAHPASHRFPW